MSLGGSPLFFLAAARAPSGTVTGGGVIFTSSEGGGRLGGSGGAGVVTAASDAFSEVSAFLLVSGGTALPTVIRGSDFALPTGLSASVFRGSARRAFCFGAAG